MIQPLTPLFTTIFLAATLCSLTATADTVNVGGTGSSLGVMQTLATAFQAKQPNTQISVIPGLGSSGSIKALIAGALDISLSGRPPNPAERAQNVITQELARTPIVLASKRKPTHFTLAELISIYDGTLNSWPDGSTLRPILRPESDSETALLRAISPEVDQALSIAYARKGVHIAIVDQDAANAIEQIPGAIGTSTLALIRSEKRKINALDLNGVTPSPATLADGSYPYFKPLYLITAPNASLAAQAFLTFIKSSRGSNILANNGYLVLKHTDS